MTISIVSITVATMNLTLGNLKWLKLLINKIYSNSGPTGALRFPTEKQWSRS